MTEQQSYEVAERRGTFELRRCPAHLVAEIEIAGSFDEAPVRAFRPLAGYINGANRSRRRIAMTAPVTQQAAGPEKIAMTAPVLQQAAGRPGRYLVQFVMPSHLTAETLPVPRDARVRTREIPRQLAAAVRFSGQWTHNAFEERGAALRRAVAAAGLRPAARCVMPVSTRRGLHGSPGATRSCCRWRSSQDGCRGAPRPGLRAAVALRRLPQHDYRGSCAAGPVCWSGPAPSPCILWETFLRPGERLESRGGSAPATSCGAVHLLVLGARRPDLRQDLGIRHGAGRQRPLDGRVVGVQSDLPAAPGQQPRKITRKLTDSRHELDKPWTEA